MSHELHETVHRLDKAVFGDRDNIKEQPGLVAEQSRLADALDTTNKILTEVRNGVLCVVALVMTGFVTALLTIVYKH